MPASEAGKRAEQGCERTADSQVKSLRRKIEEDAGRPRIIQAVPAGGCRRGLTRDD
jgi:DNA-binding response OmpR family regulator